MTTTAVPFAPSSADHDPHGYHALLGAQREHFAIATADAPPLFRTVATGPDGSRLFDLFLSTLPADDRQHYTCNACRHFVDRYGSLVTIDATGAAHSVMWGIDTAPPYFDATVRIMAFTVEIARVTGVFYTPDLLWGQPQTGPWSHFAVAATNHRFSHPLKSAGQRMAEQREDHTMLCRALADYDQATVDTAVALLQTEQLYRSEKVLGVAQWFQGVLRSITAARHPRQRDNLIWRAVAEAPAGFCHVRSSMIGTLLDDIAAGKPYDDVAAAFKAKMHPLLYQRPTAAPKAGQIAQAEHLVANLGVERSLLRRYARLDEIPTIWQPAPPAVPKPANTPVFGHLLPQVAPPRAGTVTQRSRITWVKFRDTVLPHASKLELWIPQDGVFSALVTAVDPDAPLIFQWDNPVSLYTYVHGSPARRWNLIPRQYHPVTAIARFPWMWGEPPPANHEDGVIFVLHGARDVDGVPGAAIFPETLRSEFHGIRKTIEAYSKRGMVAGGDEASACGLLFTAGKESNTTTRIRVTGTTIAEYVIDRWD